MEKVNSEKFQVVKNKVVDIITNSLSENSGETNGDFVLDNYAINSIDALEMLILIEKEFEIEIDDDDLNAELFMDIDHLAEYILNKISDDYFS